MSKFAVRYQLPRLILNKIQFVPSTSALAADAHRRLTLFRLILSLIILTVCHCSPAWAVSADAERKILSLPILYVTDRSKAAFHGDHQDFGVQMIEPVDALYYGCQQVKVKVTPSEAEEMQNLPTWGWSLRNEKDIKPVTGTAPAHVTLKASKNETSTTGTPAAETSTSETSKSATNTEASTTETTTTETSTAATSTTETKTAETSTTESSTTAKSDQESGFQNQVFDKEQDFQSLVASLRKAMEINKRREFIIFVHGCCIGFEGSMNQAAALEEATRIPVINYAWGSVRGNYGGSTMTLPRSQERFNNLVRRLLKEFPDEKITLAGQQCRQYDDRRILP